MAWENVDADVVMTMPLLGLDNDIINDADIQVKVSSEMTAAASSRIARGNEVTEAGSIRVASAGEVTEAGSARYV